MAVFVQQCGQGVAHGSGQGAGQGQGGYEKGSHWRDYED